MFNSETEPPLLYQHAHDFYKAYTNSVSYYFNLGGIEGGEEGAGEGLDDENGYNESEDGDDDDDDDDSEDIKPIKKQKKSNGPPIEKPECKQQWRWFNQWCAYKDNLRFLISFFPHKVVWGLLFSC